MIKTWQGKEDPQGRKYKKENEAKTQTHGLGGENEENNLKLEMFKKLGKVFTAGILCLRYLNLFYWKIKGLLSQTLNFLYCVL